MNRPGTHAALGSIDRGVLVIQEYTLGKNRDSDIRFYDLRRRQWKRTPRKINTKHWEYLPSRDGKFLLFARTIEFRYMVREQLVIMNLKSGRTHKVTEDNHGAYWYAYFQPGQMNGRYAVWLRVQMEDGKVVTSSLFRHKIGRPRYSTPFFNYKPAWAPSVTDDGVVYTVVTRRARCGTHAKLTRVTFEDPDFPQVSPVAVLGDGIDSAYTFARTGNNGMPRVFYERFRCGRSGSANIYEIEDAERLEVSKRGKGSGAVISKDGSIDCGEKCSASFPGGRIVVLKAKPDLGSRFHGWTYNCVRVTDTKCKVTLAQARHVKARFKLDVPPVPGD